MARVLVASDNFNRAALGADWANVGSSPIVIVASTTFNASHSGLYGLARWVGAGTFDGDQYAICTVSALSNEGAGKGVGVICRCSADTDPNFDCYYAAVDADAGSGGTHTLIIGKLVNGADSSLATTTSVVTNGDTIALEVEGTALRLYLNDVLKVSTTDAALATGLPGVLSRINAGLNLGDDWSGGDVVPDEAQNQLAWVKA